MGSCGGGPLPPIQGPQIYVDFSSVAASGVEISLKVSASTGGTAGPYVPVQYFNTLGNEGATGIFLAIPDGYGMQAELDWVSPPLYGFVEGSYVYIEEDGINVANDSYSGYYAGPITATLPTPLGATADYQIVSFFNATGPFPPTGCPIWSVDTDTWGTSTTVWNECPAVVWSTDTDEWDLSTTIWNI
jgi:hypothetical protein